MSQPVRARKRFGQHFLHDPHYIDRIVAAVAAQPGDRLVEIGPGRGAITAPLARTGASLCALEVDHDLVALLRERFADAPHVTIVQADVLEFDFASLGAGLRIVGNLPYNISTPLLFRLIGVRHALHDLHCMLQKEVVDRMVAPPGTKSYGRLTVMLGRAMRVERLFEVPPGAFTPPPKVTSAVVRLTPRPEHEVRVADEAVLARVVAQAFGQRRKTLRNALRGTAEPADLEAAGIDPGIRAESVPISAWIALSNRLARRWLRL
jgi:16S rRNA (adenine1518-N6/adenine1519-N6)-dimethyltransferase